MGNISEIDAMTALNLNTSRDYYSDEHFLELGIDKLTNLRANPVRESPQEYKDDYFSFQEMNKLRRLASEDLKEIYQETLNLVENKKGEEV